MTWPPPDPLDRFLSEEERAEYKRRMYRSALNIMTSESRGIPRPDDDDDSPEDGPTTGTVHGPFCGDERANDS